MQRSISARGGKLIGQDPSGAKVLASLELFLRFANYLLILVAGLTSNFRIDTDQTCSGSYYLIQSVQGNIFLKHEF